MPEVLQSQPPAPAAQPTQPAAPGLVEAFIGVLTKPAQFWQSVRPQTGFGPPLVFTVVMGVVSGVLTAVIAMVGIGAAGSAAGGAFVAVTGFGAIIMMPIFAVVGAFIGGAIVHVVSLIAGGKGTYEQSVRVACYTSAVMPISTLLGIVPLLGTVASLYGLYLVALGIITIHLADKRKAFIVSGVLAGLLVVFAVGGYLTARAVSNQMAGQFGKDSEFQREMQKATEELRRAAEAAQHQQQQRPAQ